MRPKEAKRLVWLPELVRSDAACLLWTGLSGASVFGECHHSGPSRGPKHRERWGLVQDHTAAVGWGSHPCSSDSKHQARPLGLCPSHCWLNTPQPQTSCLSGIYLWDLEAPGSPYFLNLPPPIKRLTNRKNKESSNVDLGHVGSLPWSLCNTGQGSALLWASISPFLKPHSF